MKANLFADSRILSDVLLLRAWGYKSYRDENIDEISFQPIKSDKLRHDDNRASKVTRIIVLVILC